MKNKRRAPFPLVIITLILGLAIYKQFDFENFIFQKPALAIVYLFAFLLSLYLLMKNFRTK